MYEYEYVRHQSGLKKYKRKLLEIQTMYKHKYKTGTKAFHHWIIENMSRIESKE